MCKGEFARAIRTEEDMYASVRGNRCERKEGQEWVKCARERLCECEGVSVWGARLMVCKSGCLCDRNSVCVCM